MTDPDFALLNGKILTGDPTCPQTESFASFRGNIIAVGSNEDIRYICGKGTDIFDAERRLVIPGFTDGHVHFVQGGLSLLNSDLSGIRSRAEFINRIREDDKRLPQGEWLTGSGWDNTLWEDETLPDRFLLDSAVSDRPVYLVRQDMHMAVVNSRVLDLANTSESTPDPGGGTIDRDPKTGIPTGIIRDSAILLVDKILPEPDAETCRRAIETACRKCRKLGITGVHDITLASHISHLEKAAGHDWFTVRMLLRPPLGEWEKYRSFNHHSRVIKIGGFKAFSDGSLGSGTALFYDPYSDDPSTSGLAHEDLFPPENDDFSRGKLYNHAQAADAEGYNLSVHAIGDRANATVLDIFERIERTNGKRDRRWRIEHAQHLHPDDIRRFGNLGVIASMQPYHCIDDARWCERRIGEERCRSSYPFKSLLESGVRLVFGSDWTVAPLNPLPGIDAAVNRVPVGKDRPWYPEQRISISEALSAYTVNPAHASFDEDSQGTLSPGNFADCAVLSENLFEIPEEEIKNVRVVATIFDGKVVYYN